MKLGNREWKEKRFLFGQATEKHIDKKCFVFGFGPNTSFW